MPAKKSAAKKTTARKSAAKKTTARKSTAKKKGARTTAARKGGTPSVASEAKRVAAQFQLLDVDVATEHADAWHQVVAHMDKPATRIVVERRWSTPTTRATIGKLRIALDEGDIVNAVRHSHSAIETIAAALPGRVLVPPPARSTDTIPGDALTGRVLVGPPRRRS